MHVILEIGHYGQPAPNHRRRGASRGEWDEVRAVRVYVGAIFAALSQRDIGCSIIATGTLMGRQAQAAEIARAHVRDFPGERVIFLSCHANITGGEQRAVFWCDGRSDDGREAAETIRRTFEHWPHRVLTRAAQLNPGDAPERSRAFMCIGGMWAAPRGCVGVLSEVVALDGDPGPDLVMLIEAGELLAEGIAAWLRH